MGQDYEPSKRSFKSIQLLKTDNKLTISWGFMLTEESKKQIIEGFVRLIDHISDKDYQKRIWIRGEGPEVDDFDETVCNFSPAADGIIEKYKDFGLTELQYQLLKKFRDQFRVFYDENDWPEHFIETPEWVKIMNLAKEVLKAFNYQKERKYL